MPDYDFGSLASPAKTPPKEAPKQAYDFGALASGTTDKATQIPLKNTDNSTFTDKLFGVGEAATTLGSSIVAGPVGAIRGVYESVTGGKYGTQEGVREGAKKGSELAERMTFTPRGAKGQQYTEAMGNFFRDAGLESLGGLGGELSTLSNTARLAKPALVVGASDAAQAVKASPAMQTLGKGAQVLGQGAKKAGAAIGETAGKVAPKVMGFEKEALALAQKADEYGINIQPHMLSNNKIVKMLGEAMEKVPLAGAKTEARQNAFNAALIKQIGGDPSAKKLTPDVFASAMKKSGKEIGRIAEKNDVKIDDTFKDGLTNFANETKKFQTKDVRNIVNSYIDEIQEKSKTGTLSGKAFKALNSKLGRQISSTSNGDLKNSLGDLQEMMHEALQGSISKRDLEALKLNRMYYAKGKTLEPLIAKTMTGDISGPSLMARVTADSAGKSRMAKGAGGELGDLARIGQLVKDPASSGTAERNMAYGLLGGSAYANPATAGTVWGAANLYNRFGNYLIPPPPK